MNQGRAIWNTDAVHAAAASGDYGAVVRAVRRAADLTLADVAQRTNYSISTLSRLETGKQHLADVRVLRGLADALDIPPPLLGLADTPPQPMHVRSPAAIVGVNSAPDEEADMRRRTLLTGLTSLAGTAAVLGTSAIRSPAAVDPLHYLEQTLLAAPSGSPPVELPQIEHDLTAAQSAFDLGRYAEVASRLPVLLPAAMATHADGGRPEEVALVNALLAQTYILASKLTVKFGRDQLAWTTADRAVQVAHSSDDILTRADARRAWAIVLRRTGHAATAHQLIVDTAATLQPDLRHGRQYIAVYGALLSTAAYTAAVDGDRDTAYTLLAEARDTAEQLDDHTESGPTAVGLYQVSAARALGDVGAAIDAARQINPAAIPSPERRARYWADVARAFHQWGKPEHCYRALLAAEQAAPDEVRYRKPVQQITLSLLRHPSANTLPGLQSFAQRTGIRPNTGHPREW
ncbi:helix-turn-helix domain-containing protein [Nocardia pseudovaccinii]|uniref:helix-turn-helix domain-containing protein n=1 Tax=Nocardia pseudovaccinii TaxID=189540 RepID=UPI0007A47184|nr:helix-turn-helix transcriptional regulator [Nocardia pseudovaccinii]